jgi:hypothetical protein
MYVTTIIYRYTHGTITSRHMGSHRVVRSINGLLPRVISYGSSANLMHPTICRCKNEPGLPEEVPEKLPEEAKLSSIIDFPCQRSNHHLDWILQRTKRTSYSARNPTRHGTRLSYDTLYGIHGYIYWMGQIRTHT